MRTLALTLCLLVPLALGATACGGDDDEPAAVRTVTAAEVAPSVARGETLLVDVREPHEWDAGHAPDALHVPLAQVGERLDEIRDEAAGRDVAFVCRTGSRSAQAAQIAVEGGLDGVLHIDGGMSAWVKAGLPLDPADGRIVG